MNCFDTITTPPQVEEASAVIELAEFELTLIGGGNADISFD
jgi:hypothetical protein